MWRQLVSTLFCVYGSGPVCSNPFDIKKTLMKVVLQIIKIWIKVMKKRITSSRKTVVSATNFKTVL